MVKEIILNKALLLFMTSGLVYRVEWRLYKIIGGRVWIKRISSFN